MFYEDEYFQEPRRFSYLKRDELATLPDLTPMIGDVLDKGTVSMLVAQPAAGKSFLAVDWACCYATGKDWQGRMVDPSLTFPNDRPVEDASALYIAAEGARGLKRRVDAWEQSWQHEVPADRLVVLPEPVQLGNRQEVGSLCRDLAAEACGLVVIDTVARCSVGLEENDAGDMGRLVDAAYRIRDALGPDGTVLLVHHLGKAGTIRGSSALLGGVDQVLRLTRDGDALTLEDEKRKDNEELEPVNLYLQTAHDSRVIASALGEQIGNTLVDVMRDQLDQLLPMSKSELRGAAGLDDQTFYRALNRGLADGLIEITQEKTPKYSLSTQGKATPFMPVEEV